MTYVITDACVDVMDKSCMKECPVDCIYEGQRQLYIHPTECIDCGACEPVCPEEAIYYVGELPPGQEAAATRQDEVFAPLGVLKGARKYGPLGVDHPDVAALPPKPPKEGE
jgi:NAD-dependent dihydropyrimidine dehydrogenase PreA subunit